MKINILFIDHKVQRYNTVGDWWWDKGTIEIRVSNFGPANTEKGYENLVLIHELTEIFIEWGRRDREIVFPELATEVDAFDKQFERLGYAPTDEPGCDPRAPYYKGHMIANAVEHLLAMVGGVDYNDYASEVDKLVNQ